MFGWVRKFKKAPTAEDPKIIKYPKLEPRAFASVDAQTYISERFNDAISWYDSKAADAKKLYQRMRTASVIGGVMVPVLVNIHWPEGEAYLKAVTTVVSTIVVLLVSLESVFHFREQWINYRSTEQFLRREYFLFTTREGVYTGITDDKKAFTTFVERVEAKIESENASTLQILTTVSEAVKGQRGEQGTTASETAKPHRGEHGTPIPEAARGHKGEQHST